MKTNNTYSMLIQSEEKGRSIFESVICALAILCIAFTGWEFASHAVVTPGMERGSDRDNGTEMLAKVPADQPVVAAIGS